MDDTAWTLPDGRVITRRKLTPTEQKRAYERYFDVPEDFLTLAELEKLWETGEVTATLPIHTEDVRGFYGNGD